MVSAFRPPGTSTATATMMSLSAFRTSTLPIAFQAKPMSTTVDPQVSPRKRPGRASERIFPLHSPSIDRIEVIRHGKVRRAKLYYLRKLRGKAARIEERREDRPKSP